MDPSIPNSLYLIDIDQIQSLETAAGSKKRIRSTDDQMEKIISFMDNHSDFAKGSTKIDDEKSLAWEMLTAELNSMGPPEHSSKEWRTVWSRFKANKKRKSDAGSSIDSETDASKNESMKSGLYLDSDKAVECQNCLNGSVKSGQGGGQETRSDLVVIDLLNKIVENTSNILVALSDLKEAVTANSLCKN